MANVEILTRSLIDTCSTQLNSEGTGQKPTKSIPDVAWSSQLLMCTYASAKNARGISLPSLLSPNIIWLPWQCPFTNWKIRYWSIICTQSAYILSKDCENWSSISWDIWLNTPVFWPCHTRRSQMSSVNSGVTGPKFTKLLHDIEASFTLLMCTLR